MRNGVRSSVNDPEPQSIAGILVVGGGYAGLHAVRAAERAGAAVTVVDAAPEHSFVTRLAAVAGGTAPVSDASTPFDRLIDSSVVGRVSAVGDGWVRLDDERTFEADAVVVTTGSRSSRPSIPGIELAAPLRTADHARQLRAGIESAEAVVIIGGGASGVQLAGATAYAHPATEVHVVEAGPELLPGLASPLGRNAARILRDRGVEIHLGTPVEEIHDHGVRTTEGPIAGLVVWAGGFTADASSLGLPVDDTGRIAVDDDLVVHGTQRTFAAGDVAAHRDTRSEPLPMSAQVAVRAGTEAGRNAARRARGAPTRPVDLSQIGWVLDLGGRRGLAQVGPIPLAAPLLDLVPPILHDAIDIKNLVEIAGLGALLRGPELLRLIPRPA